MTGAHPVLLNFQKWDHLCEMLKVLDILKWHYDGFIRILNIFLKTIGSFSSLISSGVKVILKVWGVTWVSFLIRHRYFSYVFSLQEFFSNPVWKLCLLRESFSNVSLGFIDILKKVLVVSLVVQISLIFITSFTLLPMPLVLFLAYLFQYSTQLLSIFTVFSYAYLMLYIYL